MFLLVSVEGIGLMIDIAMRTLFYPLLVWQGATVRRKALRLPDAVGARSGVRGNGPDLSLLILGDSSAAGVGTSHQEEALLGQMRKRLSQTNRVSWKVMARTGATTAEMLERLKREPAQHFDVVSVSLGCNDITTLVAPQEWCAQYGALLDLLEQKFGARLICVSGIPEMKYFPLLPQPLRWVLGKQAERFDRLLQRLVEERAACRFVRMDFKPDVSLMSADGYHPGPKIYAQWGGKVYRAIRRDLRRLNDWDRSDGSGNAA